ncbi:MAG: hypothetical protein ACRC6U_04255 [Fusobacteriaceae bacterium]
MFSNIDPLHAKHVYNKKEFLRKMKQSDFYDFTENDRISTEHILYENYQFFLKKRIYFIVRTFENRGCDYFTINNTFLDISTIKNDIYEAIDAINSSFYSLYMNYYLEHDKNLTDKAIELKRKLQDLIKEVRKKP